MKENSKTKRKIWKLVNLKEIWNKLTEQDEDLEIKEIENPDTEKFYENLKVLEEKIESKKASKNKYKTINVKEQAERNKKTVERERD